MIGDKTPSLRDFSEHGIARVSHGPRLYLAALNALEEAARAASSL
jgi:2-methylisocitrate lyase-like PEP mutase family enzyme